MRRNGPKAVKRVFSGGDGEIVGSDITGGFMVVVFAGVYGMSALFILGEIMALRLSSKIRSGFPEDTSIGEAGR